jgi:hypothetical protein
MLKTGAVLAGFMLLAMSGTAHATEPAKLLAAGEWSKVVADKDGYALRGRLVLCEHMLTVGGRDGFPQQQRREVITYVELQDASDFVGRSMRLFCDFGKTDFRPENKSGLQCEMVDKEHRAVPAASFPFGGATPQSQWITLPGDATIRLRSTPFGVHREHALAIAPTPDKLWVIAENDAAEYFLSGTFTIEPSNEIRTRAPQDPAAEHSWHGTIDLPAVRISTRAFAAATQPVSATTQAATTEPDAISRLVASFAGTHGVWLNGASPELDLPADATDDEVLTKLFKMITPPEGKITSYKIRERRRVELGASEEIPPDKGYQAFELETNIGPKIVLVRHYKTGGWWCRTYALPSSGK